MQHPFDTHSAVEYAEENHITSQCRHAQAGSQVLAAGIAQRGAADLVALIDEPSNETPGVGPAVLGDEIADVEKILPGLRRERDFHDYAGRLALGLRAGLPTGSA